MSAFCRMCPWLSALRNMFYPAAGMLMDTGRSRSGYPVTGASGRPTIAARYASYGPYSEETRFKRTGPRRRRHTHLSEFLAERQAPGGDPQGDRHVSILNPGPRRQTDWRSSPTARPAPVPRDGRRRRRIPEFQGVFGGGPSVSASQSRWNGPSEHSTRIMTTGSASMNSWAAPG